MPDDDGAVAGFFCPCEEITEQVLEARRVRLRAAFAEKLRAAQGAEEILLTAAEMLGRSLGADRAASAVIDPAGETAIIEREWRERSAPSVVGRHRLEAFGPRFIDELKAGRTVAIADVHDDPRTSGATAAFERNGIAAFLDVPLLRQGRLAMVLAIHAARPRRWTPGDVALAEEIAERSWSAVERARSEAAERRRAAQMQALAEASLAITAAPSLEATLDEIADAARRVVGARRGGVSLIRGADGSGGTEPPPSDARSERCGGFDAPPDGAGASAAVCERNRPARLTRAELDADPRWPGFGPDAPEHPPMRGWLAAPLVGQDGSNLGLIQLSDKADGGEFDETDEAVLVQLAQLASAAVERASTAAALIESERRLASERAFLHAVIESAPVGISIARDPRGEPPIINAEARRMTGVEEFAGDAPRRYRTLRAIHEDGRPYALEDYPTVKALAGVETRDLEMRYDRDGEVRRWLLNSRPLKGEDGAVVAAVTAFVDIEEQRRAEEHRALLMDELNHRVKNTLAIVQALANQTFGGGATDPAALDAFAGRLSALAQTHNLLTRRSWSSASLGELVRTALGACGAAGRARVEGPEAPLGPKTAVSIAMALHELCTNAAKYGALSRPEGLIEVSWRLDGGEAERRLNLEWRERGGPAVAPPGRRGFGSRMIERALAAELRGRVSLDFRPEGVVCEIDAPLASLAAQDARRP